MNSANVFSVHILTQGAGGGHHATLRALQAIVEQQQRPWQIQVTDIGELSASLDPSKQLFGLNPNELYNQMVRRGWTWLHPLTMWMDKQLMQLFHQKGVKLGEQHWQQQASLDLVISLVPLRNRIIWDSVQRVSPATLMVTILTDFADCPPHFWLEPQTSSYVICGTERAVAQAHTLGVSDAKIIPTSGLLVQPKFYQPLSSDRRAERQRLGLDPDRKTAIVSFGANGSTSMLQIARSLEHLHDQIQIIFLCGSNQALAYLLKDRSTQVRQWIQGFTEDVPYFMHLADFFIGKPGCVSISEAIVMNLPVIVDRNASTLLNERYVADWIVEKQIGLAISSFQKIAQAVETLLQPDEWTRYKANVTAIQNRSIFEVPDILQTLLDRAHANRL